MSKGIVFKVQKFCLDDGPGIRTTVFLKGCSLRCSWCHNWEGLSCKPSLGYFEERCVNCHCCEMVCPQKVHVWKEEEMSASMGVEGERAGRSDGNENENSGSCVGRSDGPKGNCGDRWHGVDRTRCVLCGKCIEACSRNALVIAGKEYEAEEIMKQVRKDIPFYRQSGGGVTLSGGEPLLQPEFCMELAAACKREGIHVAIETAGAVPWPSIEMLIPYTDLWLFDLKESDPERFKRETGGELEVVMKHLDWLLDKAKSLVVRCPIIPGIQDRREHLQYLSMLRRQGLRIQLMPYHNIGVYKAKVYSEDSQKEYQVPDQQRIKEWEEELAAD